MEQTHGTAKWQAGKKTKQTKRRQGSCQDIYINRPGFLLSFQQSNVSLMEDQAKVFRLHEILTNSYSCEYEK